MTSSHAVVMITLAFYGFYVILETHKFNQNKTQQNGYIREKTMVCLWYHETRLITLLRRKFVKQFGTENVPGFFQQDGAPPHFTLSVSEFLNEQYPNRWIGRNGLIFWSPRSSDTTPLDFFFLWGYVKNRVFCTSVRMICHLKT